MESIITGDLVEQVGSVFGVGTRSLLLWGGRHGRILHFLLLDRSGEDGTLALRVDERMRS
jgi:hypothetical protein